MKYADPNQKRIYETEAKAIDEIQKGILEISQKEEPFDIFICYKETDNHGRRTPDSVLATELYHELTEIGFKVFFSRITLEDKLGSAYEPYIFAALNSSKVMVVLGTRAEYFNAVWVKNEWNRYLALIRQGAKKTLIPAYKDMDPYDLPEEFSHLQALDMSKLGFMQDLTHGIQKLVEPEKEQEDDTATSGVTVNSLLKRAHIFLEDEDWASADEYCEKVLDMDPEFSDAYIGKLLAFYHCKTEQELTKLCIPIENNNNFEKALRFADPETAQKLKSYQEQTLKNYHYQKNEEIYQQAMEQLKYCTNNTPFIKIIQLLNKIPEYKDAKEKIAFCKEKIYQLAIYELESAVSIPSFYHIISLLENIPDYKDSTEKIKLCNQKIEDCNYAPIYSSAKLLMQSNILSNLYTAKEKLESIPNYHDAKELIKQCNEKISETEDKLKQNLSLQHQKKMERRRLIKIIGIPIVILAVSITVGIIIFSVVISPSMKYNQAISDFNNGNYLKAADLFSKADSYQDSSHYLQNCIENFNGQTVTFGNYPQTDPNQKEPIEWKILTVKDGNALLLSDKSLDCQPFIDSSDDYGTWYHSTLRKWLNEDFMKTAFSKQEQQKMITSTISTPPNPTYGTLGGQDTKDKLFLLSIDEVETYFPEKQNRFSLPTQQLEDTILSEFLPRNGWYLRSPGMTAGLISCVSTVGEINMVGKYAENRMEIRPAMWIAVKEFV